MTNQGVGDKDDLCERTKWNKRATNEEELRLRIFRAGKEFEEGKEDRKLHICMTSTKSPIKIFLK